MLLATIFLEGIHKGKIKRFMGVVERQRLCNGEMTVLD